MKTVTVKTASAALDVDFNKVNGFLSTLNDLGKIAKRKASKREKTKGRAPILYDIDDKVAEELGLQLAGAEVNEYGEAAK